MVMILNLLIIVFFMTWALTWLVKRYAIAKQMVDIPNFRSSHKNPTPRGGGVAFVGVFLITNLCLMYLKIIYWPGSFLLLGAVFLVAIIGFYDDRSQLVAKWRFMGQFAASIIALYAIGYIPDIVFFHWTLHQGYLVNVCAAIYLVWMLNLYNFMDGIDGLASIEAISVCLGVSFLYWLTGNSSAMILPLILSSALTGFLYWNFPPARIFMGDVGSSFLGFIFGVMSLQSLFIGEQFLWSWLILLGVFIADATITLFYRLIQGEKVYLAHCTHAYQHAAKLAKNHLPVTLGVLLINLLWLWPLSILVGLKYIEGITGFIIAYIPICALTVQFKAGRELPNKS
jgi:Fuc2NAc and GlcNAc transferase